MILPFLLRTSACRCGNFPGNAPSGNNRVIRFQSGFSLGLCYPSEFPPVDLGFPAAPSHIANGTICPEQRVGDLKPLSFGELRKTPDPGSTWASRIVRFGCEPCAMVAGARILGTYKRGSSRRSSSFWQPALAHRHQLKDFPCDNDRPSKQPHRVGHGNP